MVIIPYFCTESKKRKKISCLHHTAQLDKKCKFCYNTRHITEREAKALPRHFRTALTVICCLLLTGCGFRSITPSGPAETTDVSTVSASASSAAPQTETTAVPPAPATEPVSEDPPSNGSEAAPDTEFPAAAHLIRNVPHLDQTTGYATACESLAAVSLLQYYGIEIEPGDFIRKHLPVADYPSVGEDGNLHGESPWEYFIGSPLRTNGYGCFSGAIQKAIDSVEPGKAVVLRDKTLDELCEQYVANGAPVMIWGTIRMQKTREGNSWILPNGEWYTHIRPEHALLLIGWDENNYYFSDSLSAEAVTPYPVKDTKTAYDAMHRQAIVLNMPAPYQNEDTPLTEDAAE